MSANELPKTVEEYERALQLARREAFEQGVNFEYGRRGAFRPVAEVAQEEARRRYPIKKKVPRRITMPEGWGGGKLFATVAASGRVLFTTEGGQDWPRGVEINKANVDALADLLANPTEEVEE